MPLTLPHTLTAGTNENVTHVQNNFVEIANAFPVQTANIGDSQVTSAKLATSVAQVPVGTLVDYVGAGDPTDTRFLLADGRAISRATYSVLYGIAGTAFGVGDGSTTFNIPDLRGRVGAGLDNMGTAAGAASRLTGATRGAVGGTETHTLTTAQMPAHTHTLPYHPNLNFTGTGFNPLGVDGGSLHGSSSAGGGTSHPNTQPYQVVNKLLRVV